MTKQTRSFTIVVCIAVLAAYAAVLVSRAVKKDIELAVTSDEKIQQSQKPQPTQTVKSAQDRSVDTSSWITYSAAPAYPISFKVPSDWTSKMTTAQNDTLHIIVLHPPTSSDNIRVYISQKSYFAMDGITTTPKQFNGNAAISRDDILVGMKYAKNYYTFDIGQALELRPEFSALLGTVTFIK